MGLLNYSVGETFAWLALILVIDALLGDPDWLWRRLPHPIVLIGRGIAFIDKWLNNGSDNTRRMTGILAICLVVVTSLGVGAIIAWLLLALPFGGLLTAAIGAIFIAQRALYVHVAKVASALTTRRLSEARKALSLIVGRNTTRLEQSGICRAAIESCAENFNDAVVAPIFWAALFGLPGLITYKAINTADSMIGHKTKRYLAFGWGAARLDDIVNFIPARISAILIALAGGLVKGCQLATITGVVASAKVHDSPNAGYPEAAAAIALKIALGGSRDYGEITIDQDYLNPTGRSQITSNDIQTMLKVLWSAWAILTSTLIIGVVMSLISRVVISF